MQVKIKLFGVFRIGRFKEQLCEYRDGTTVQQIADDLQLPEQILGIVLINGVHAELGTILRNGDELAILPLFDGG